jgi:hypothetical protein
MLSSTGKIGFAGLRTGFADFKFLSAGLRTGFADFKFLSAGLRTGFADFNFVQDCRTRLNPAKIRIQDNPAILYRILRGSCPVPLSS